jgi:hypothetical protein
VTVLKHGEGPPVALVPASAVGIGFTGALGAVLLEVLHSGGASVAISLIAGSTIIIVAGFVTFGLLSRTSASALITARAAADPLHGSPFRLDLPQNWDQQSVRATVRNDETDEACDVLCFRPNRNGGTEAYLVKPDGPRWYNLDMLTSVVIGIGPEGSQRKQLTG